MQNNILCDCEAPSKAFVDSWRDIAERFSSACWHNPMAGHNTAIDAALGPEHFPCPMLWTLVRVLSGCATAKAEPTLSLVADAVHDLGEPIAALDLAEIRWRVSSPAGLGNFAALLVEYARRRALHDIVGRWQADALDVFEPVGDVAKRVLADVHDWQLDGTRLPEPPKLKRPPAIVLRPSIARESGTPARRKRRNPGKVRMRR